MNLLLVSIKVHKFWEKFLTPPRLFVAEHSKKEKKLESSLTNMETVATNSTQKPKSRQQLSVRPPIRRGCLFLGARGRGRGGGEGGASAVGSGCGGLPLQKRLSIGAASVSSPSHQTGA